MTAPVRLLADAQTAGELQADLLALRDYDAPFDLEASLTQFEARLERGDLGSDSDLELDAPELDAPELDAPEQSGAPTTAGQSAGHLTAGKLAAALALAAGAGWGVLQLTDSIPSAGTGAPSAEAPAQLAEVPEKIETELIEVEPSPVVETAPEATPAAPATAAPAPSSTRRQAAARKPAEAAPAPPAPLAPSPGAAADEQPPKEAVEPPRDALQREVAQLGTVRRALSTDPARALELADRGHREFQAGSLYQEREALALRALSALGEQDALESRGRAFLLRFPQSSFAREVDQMLRK